MREALVVSAALGLALVLVPSSAWAHTVGLSTGEYTVRGSRVDGTLVFARGEIARVAPLLDENGDGHVSAAEVANARPQLRARVLGRVSVTSGGRPCAVTLTDAAVTELDGLLVAGRWACEGPADRLELPLLDDLSRGHRHVARLVTGKVTQDRVLDRDTRALAIEPSGETPPVAKSPSPSTPSFFRLGVEHIVTGWDHLLFLLGLVLVPGRARAIALVVTAFTVAHSITLALATLGVWMPSPRIVEPAIALSIVYVGIESLYARDVGKRWRVTFPFGLVHGFGFAGALREIALPRDRLPGALLAFNIGVEVGQLAVLAVVLPLLVVLRKRAGEERVVRVAAIAIAAIGAVWFVVRVVSG